MIRVSQLKMNITHNEEELCDKLLKSLKISKKQLVSFEICKKSIDARKKNDIKYIYTIDAKVLDEGKVYSRLKDTNISIFEKAEYNVVQDGTIKLKARPIIVGTGPAGIFCALKLAEQGYQPLVIERGEDVDSRVRNVQHFWTTNELDVDSNVQFGEGGAGTFSDGKLNTLVKDVSGRNTEVLLQFVHYGAPGEILYLNKPHIGTDRLRSVVKSMRERIIELGGEVRFQTKLTDIHIEDGKVQSIEVNGTEVIPCEVLVLAIGHSARDTFELLHRKQFDISKKAFAIGVRLEHPQELISESQYGESYTKLPPADYKLTHQSVTGRGVYSFCMCPGGFVVNASSEERRLVVNGMSNYARDEKNANSAMIVTVTPEDFDSDSPLAGMYFQRKWEELAYQTGNGLIPVQLFGDFCRNRKSTTLGKIQPNLKGGYNLSNIRECLPSYVSETLIDGIKAFDRKIKGFQDEESILSGVETRTSSPIRINRNDALESNIEGIYPCGEGAGYAGGITSAAMDGLKVFEMIMHKYKS
jgi:uncharacterized FAD-dependent dehydrogenase